MRELILKDFQKLFPHCPLSIANEQLPLLNATMQQYRINNRRRIAAFCATLAQESGEFRYRSELDDGWDYEGRRDLGNIKRGDGPAMKGHGRIQITGRDNHTLYAQYIKKSGHVPYIDFSDQKLAKRICDDPYALDASGWFWSVLHDLNSFADRGDFLKTQIKVNGRNKRTGLPNHWKERNDYYQRALRILPGDIGFYTPPPPTAPDPSTKPSGSLSSKDDPIDVPATIAAVPAESNAATNILDNGMLSSAVASVDAKQAGKTVLTKVGLRLARPAMLLFGALEAGNVFAWLGVLVLIIGLGVVIYCEREDLKRAVQWLMARLQKRRD